MTATTRPLPPWPYPRLCAHRGAGKLAPENTLTAMRVGHAHGYSMVEFDVKLAADNVAFLLHDATLERTTSGRGRADALLWRELSRLDAGGWHSAKYAGEMIPTFAAIARWATRRGYDQLRANSVAMSADPRAGLGIKKVDVGRVGPEMQHRPDPGIRTVREPRRQKVLAVRQVDERVRPQRLDHLDGT